MKAVINNYNQYLRFIDLYLPGGFKDVDRTNPFVLKLEETAEANDQFFCIFDLIQLKFLFTSRRSLEMMGIKPDEINPSSFYKSMHPDDLIWHNIAQTKLFSLGQHLFIEHIGSAYLSTNFRLKNAADEYLDTLVQCYLFFTEVPYKTVFILQVFTNISWFQKTRPGYHFSSGYDPASFRYPEEELLLTGNVFSKL